MDRFIEYNHNKDREKNTSLKSNMDRFIDLVNNIFNRSLWGLKSNMDRFIVQSILQHICGKRV